MLVNASEQQCDCRIQDESFSLFGFQAKNAAQMLMYRTPLCQTCLQNKKKQKDSMLSTLSYQNAYKSHATKQTCICSYTYTYTGTFFMFLLFFLVWKNFKQNRFPISSLVQHWHAGPVCAVQRWLCSMQCSPQASALFAAVFLCG